MDWSNLNHAEVMFFALSPPREAALQLRSTAQRLNADLGAGMRLQPMDRLHLTLAGLGGFDALPPALIAEARGIAERLEVGPFDLAFDHVAGSGRWVMLGDGGLAGPRRCRSGCADSSLRPV